MTCPLCGNKPSWCDCTQEAYELADLKEQISAENGRLARIEKKIDKVLALLEPPKEGEK